MKIIRPARVVKGPVVKTKSNQATEINTDEADEKSSRQAHQHNDHRDFTHL